MLATISAYLKTPRFDDSDKQREFNTLNTILLTLLVASIPAMYVTSQLSNPIELYNVVVATIIALTSLVLIRNGIYVIPRYAIPGWLMVLVTYSIVRGSGLHDITLSGYWMIIALASLMIGRPAPLVFSGLTVLTMIGVYGGEHNGYIDSGRGPSTSMDLIVLSIFIFISAVLLQILMSNMEQSIERAKASEQRVLKLNNELEHRVADRTRDLTVAASVSTGFSSILDLQELLAQVTSRTREGFELYHTSIFLFDEAEHSLNLYASSGRGNKRLAEMHFELDDKGLVPRTARSRQPVLVNDVKNVPDYYSNPALPDTHAELSLPIISGDDLIGVLDLQADQPGVFSDDYIRAMTPLATQIGIAVKNARLYAETEEARRAAEEANEIKSQFLANMSHELRTPLNAILNFTGFVAKGVMGPVNEQQEQTLNEAIDSGKHLLSLINDILDITKIEAGLMDLFIQEVNMNEMVGAAASIAKGLVKNKSIDLNIDIAEDLPTTYGDKRRLRQVMLNLVSNAVKFTPEGRVSIIALKKDADIFVSVKDTGIGIDPKDHDLVFDSFKQAKHELSETVGTGLGMPISKYFVETHGGRLWFDSAPGKGTTFYMELPVMTEEQAKQISEALVGEK
jgi:signal transduction histidine kinase